MFQNQTDFAKLFTGKLPTLDLDAVVDAHKKNLDTLTKVSLLLATGAQTFWTRQAEVARDTVKQTLSVATEGFDAKDIKASAEKGGEIAKVTAEKAVATTQELAEIVSKSANEAFAVLRARAEESAAEFNALLKRAA
ncbi:MAG TPA: TIGR01841 family phasin [Alphaproteobacteria bacterium]|nr:TIGR01841 family phasin [Alphaproteobacteria bacterium]